LFCLYYKTGDQDSTAQSYGHAEIEVIFSNDTNCKIEFSLNEHKAKGDENSVCHNVTCASGIDSPEEVRIRQASTDGWNIQKMQIQTYPGSSDFITYSLDGTNTQFWVDGDNNGGYDSPVCSDGQWCNLMRIDPDGNPLHII
jgi:hypothetical protein